MLFFSHYVISSFKFTVGEIMGKEHHQLWDVIMDFKTKFAKEKVTYLGISVNMGTG